eukprot:451909-Pleurochrysis_carterae.AAC.3
MGKGNAREREAAERDVGYGKAHFVNKGAEAEFDAKESGPLTPACASCPEFTACVSRARAHMQRAGAHKHARSATAKGRARMCSRNWRGAAHADARTHARARRELARCGPY